MRPAITFLNIQLSNSRDLMYIENYSLFLDFKILLMTAIAIFAKDNHEDFSKWDML